METKNKKVDNNNLKKVENILKDIDFGLQELDDKIDYFVTEENGKEENEENELTKEDFVFVLKNKVDELKKLLKLEEN